MWAEGRRELVSWMEGVEGAEEERRSIGEEEEEEETLGDKEWEAKFAEVGEMVEMYLRMKGAQGGTALRKTLMERATEEKSMNGPVEKKKVGRMQPRDERDTGWRARYEEIRAMVQLEEDAERGVWRK